MNRTQKINNVIANLQHNPGLAVSSVIVLLMELRDEYRSSGGDVYLETIDRMEPEIAIVDPGAYYASASISLRRIADALEALNKPHSPN